MDFKSKKFYFDRNNFSIINRDGQNLFISNKMFKWIKTQDTGVDILNRLDGETTIEQIISDMSSEYMIPSYIIERDVILFCETCLENNLIHEGVSINSQMEYSKKLNFLYVDVTNACNLKCLYCNKCVESTNNIKHMKVSEFRKLITTLFSNDAASVLLNITGGEPLLNPEIDSILEVAMQFKFKTVLWTNGTLVNEIVADKLAKYCEYVVLSVDNFSKEENDKIRGNGSFEGVVKAAEIFKQKNINFLLAVTPTIYNFDSLQNIITFIYDLGAAGFILNEPILIKENRGNLSEHFNYDIYELNKKEKALAKRLSIINSWKNTKLKSKEKNFVFMKDIQRCTNQPFAVRPKINCGALINEISVGVDGKIYPCHTLHIDDLSIGSADDFMKGKFKTLTIEELDECPECMYKIFCLGGCRAKTLFHTKTLTGKNPYCDIDRKMYDEFIWGPLQPVGKR